MPHKDPAKKKDYNADWRAKNRDKQKEYNSARDPKQVKGAIDKYRASVKGKLRHRIRALKRFGLSPEDYDRLLRDQNGVCKICRQPEKDGKNLAVDHCHKTNRIRGLLCSRCNRILGNMEDSPLLLRSAADYLERGS